MPDQEDNKPVPRTRDGTLPSHVFIDQGPQSYQIDNSRIVASQARRFQSAGKRRRQKISARLDAGYARSLVGWRSTSSTPSDDNLPREVSPSHRLAEQGSWHDHQDQLEENNYGQVEINLSIEVGLRVDPFSAFPSSNSRSVMCIVDYCKCRRLQRCFWLFSPQPLDIHVWGPHKSGHFDQLMGYNTQLDLCWPVALQDDMLFDATVTVSRVAMVLSQGKSPAADPLMLYHRGLAMRRLRQRVSLILPPSSEAVVFTIGRMISIAVWPGSSKMFLVFLANKSGSICRARLRRS